LKSFLHPVTKWLTRLSEYLITFGSFGLFAVALLDSTFVPLPSSADALMLLLTTTYPSWMLLYAFMATSGSAIGCWILYLVSRRAGARALNRFSEKKRARVKNLIERYDMMAVLVATLLPPPFPFKLFVVTAGVFRFSLVRFMIAIIAGRAFRFLLEGSESGWSLRSCSLYLLSAGSSELRIRLKRRWKLKRSPVPGTEKFSRLPGL
jgi:membrane protein YqaA with SNARE-associated domain